VPSSVIQAPERTFRAGEFLQSPISAPGAQFDTEDTESPVDKSVEAAAAEEVDALTELEPMAAAVEEAPTNQAEPQQPLSGWAALQARLTKTVPAAVEDVPAKSELLSYGETPSYGTKAAPAEDKDSAKKYQQPESRSEAALFAYMAGEQTKRSELAAKPDSKRGRIFVGILAAACVALVAVPRSRQGLQVVFRSVARAGGSWLNPPPAPIPQAVPQHDSFGQSGDEYKLPTVENIPDATTDPSQVRVLPVVDPTAKPEKGSEANGGQAQMVPGETRHADQNPAGSSQGGSSRARSSQTEPGQSGPAQAGATPVNDPTTSADVPGNAAGTAPVSVPPALQVQPNAPARAADSQPRLAAPPVPKSSLPHALSAVSSAGIPPSLKSQIASMTPASGGNKPPEAAMSSIEPVNLPESAVRELLTQFVDPEYPAAARTSGQRGSVVLQVLIGHDGAVQDAKFLSGSLVFARVAINAVKQWHFKPYSMNGRAVSVQSVITLKFQPPAANG
jgi:protein TonB